MKYRKINKTDLTASVFSLGTAEFGSAISKEESFRLMDAFVENGGNFLDTAHIYADWQCEIAGVSEITIGEWLKKRRCRDKTILATKGGSYTSDSSVPRLEREQLIGDCKLGLHRLQIDCIDLYWLHRDDQNRPVEEILQTMEVLKKEGLVRWYGASNWSWKRLKEANELSAKKDYSGFVASQIQWSLADINPEGIFDTTQVFMDKETLVFHRETGMPQIPYTPQASGFFSGKYSKNDPKSGKPHVHIAYSSEKNWDKLHRVKIMAEQTNCSTNQIALAYLINQPFPVFPIVGCRNAVQIIDSCGASEILLSPEQVLYLETGAECK